MTSEDLFCAYMRAVLDSKRDPALLPPDRLLAAYRTLQGGEVDFQLWAVRMGCAAQLQEMEKAEIAETERSIVNAARAMKAAGVDVTITENLKNG